MKCISTVTFGVIAYNEQLYLPGLLNDLLKQTYDKKLIEVIIVDGNSQDSTWEIMDTFQREHRSEFKDIKLFHNQKRIQPAGWNIVIQHLTTDILLRIDAHARLPKDFIEQNVKCINTGEDVCGGPRENIIDDNSSLKQMLLAAEQSLFGSGVAPYRQETKAKKYVKSLFHGAYRKEVLERVGLFNENLTRTEDNEYHYRVTKAGYKICYDPTIHSFYQTRNSLKGMIKQKYLNGLWIGKTLFVCPQCISVFHLVPFIFVIAIVFTTIMYLGGIVIPAILFWIAYFSANIGISLLVSIKKHNLCNIALPIVFFLLHFCYGVGTIKGISEMIIKKVDMAF